MQNKMNKKYTSYENKVKKRKNLDSEDESEPIQMDQELKDVI